MSRRGLTLVEVLVSMALLSLVAALVLHLYNSMGAQRQAQRLSQVQTLARSASDLLRGEWSRQWTLPAVSPEQPLRLRLGPGGDALPDLRVPQGFGVEAEVRRNASDTLRTVIIRVTDPAGKTYEYATLVVRSP